MRRGKLIVISAPSGAGKTTIAKEIRKRYPKLAFSVSATTRPRRSGEVEGEDYYFLSKEEFERQAKAGDFVEWEAFFGNLYGTLKKEVDRFVNKGQHLLFDVDVNGGLSIKSVYPDALLIFIRPPSFEELQRRLRERRTEDDIALATRLERVPMELEKGAKFDIEVVNDKLERTIGEVTAIIEKHLTTTE